MNRLSRLAAGVALALLGGSPAVAADDAAAAAFIDRALAGFLAPAYAGLAEEADRLRVATAALCTAPGPAALDATRVAFAATVRAWARVAFVAIGPAGEDNRRERIHFWPDPRGAGLRQVMAVLAAEDTSAADPAALRGRSVALQGLGALEVLLNADEVVQLADPASAGSFRCRFAAAIAGSVATVAGDLAAGFAVDGAFAAAFRRPGPGSATVRSRDEALAALVGAAAGAVEIVRDRILAPALGDGPDTARPRAAPFWRSGLSLAYADAMLAGAAALMEAGDLAALLPAGDRWLAQSISLEAAHSRRALSEPAVPLAEAVRAEKTRGPLRLAGLVLDNLKALVTVNLVGALGIEIGFNALDGD